MYRKLLWIVALGAFANDEFFESRVRPVLARNCAGCHSEQAKMGGLVTASREALLAGGKSGAAIAPGKPEASTLIRAVGYGDPKLKMPPAGKLAANEIADLTEWVRMGAPWPEAKQTSAARKSWWAFQPVRKPAAPAVRNAKWARGDVDRFILAKLEAAGLAPVGEADRRTWIRRASLDLTGLPPSPEDVDTYVKDRSPDAKSKVIDRLLESPRYGERWGRYWLDIARYSDDKLNSTQDDPLPNVWRYRDWVIDAVNQDMGYDKFLMAQIAGDLMPERDKYIAGMGFFANSPQFQDDRVDALTRGFLGLTVACAQCHDHKFDPIPTKDYYGLLGVFESSKTGEYPLADRSVVEDFKRRTEAHQAASKAVTDFEADQAKQLAEILAAQSAAYIQAMKSGAGDGLDAETLRRWKDYLEGERKHPYLDTWREAGFDAAAFERRLLDVIEEKNAIDRENLILLGGKDDGRTVRVIEVKSLERDKYVLWKELVSSERLNKKQPSGVLYYKGAALRRFLAPQWKQHLARLEAAREQRKKEVPEQYPFILTLHDVDKPKNIRVRIRGSKENLGDEAPRRFLSALCDGEPAPFVHGSGRLELAEAIASPANPLTARVAVNRVWGYHFGQPLVATPGNFGQLGEKPTHPELLDYLAARLVESGWSMKALHREILLSSTYALSSADAPEQAAKDGSNHLLWKFNRRRLDAEPMRDTLLMVSGDLDERRGGEALKLTDAKNLRRTVYGFVSRRSLDRTLGLFDFPNPMATSDWRVQTATPLQQLYFLNSTFVQDRARSLARRVADAGTDEARIQAAYRILFQRPAAAEELKLGAAYLTANPGETGWARYAQALLGSNELLFVE